MKRRLFVLSDVHGHATLMRAALERAGFDPTDDTHLLLCCGDYFDRGEENMEVLRYLERLPRKILLRGNHEDMLLKLLNSGKLQPHHYLNGTLQTVTDFFGPYAIDPTDDTVDFSGHSRTVDRLCDFIGETVDWFETDRYVFIHGWLPHGGHTAEGRAAASPQAWAKAREQRWTMNYKGVPPLADKTLVCGHMPTLYAWPFDPNRKEFCADIFYGNGLIAIDGGTHTSRQVNVLVLEEDVPE